MFVEERQNLILEELRENGKVRVKDLSAKFHVTPDLIRKDLSTLESLGKCKKIYGGAILNRLNIHLEDANSRKNINVKKKQSLAHLAYDLIKENMIVFLDISTTNIELAKLLVLKPIRNITIVTNMLDVLQILTSSSMHTICVGGEFDYAHNGFVGNMCDEFLSRFHFDLAFLGVVGVNLQQDCVMTYMPDDGQTKRMVLKHTKQAYMLAESDKLYQSGNYTYAKVKDFYGMITEDEVKIIKNNKK